MKDYTVYFEIYGKKLRTTVLAENKEEAKTKVIKKIIFHKIEAEQTTFNKVVDMFTDFFKSI